MARVYRTNPDDWEPKRFDLQAIPGQDVLSLEIRHLSRLPAPWRIRIAIGESEIDACSAVLPGTWSAAELVYLLAAILMDRLTTAQVESAAKTRKRVSAGERWSWERVSGGLVGVSPEVEGTVGEALERVRGRVVGAWSGIESNISEEQHRESKKEGQGPVRGVRARKWKPRGKVPQVSRR